MRGLMQEASMPEKHPEMRSLALTPTWSVATVLTIFVAVSLVVERSIHRLSHWLRKTRRNPLFEALEKMKEELMLLGFISLLLTATSRLISNICIDSRFYSSRFSPCSRAETEDTKEGFSMKNGSRPLMHFVIHDSVRRKLMDHNMCKEGHEPFVSYEGLEQLHRFIFVMAITHVSYSCLTMLLAIVKIHTWRKWEDEACRDRHGAIVAEVSRALTMRRQSTFVKSHTANSWSRNKWLVWVICFFRQFGISVVRADYLSLRTGFVMNHNLLPTYDFHSYMIRSMEEEFKMIVGVSAPLWGFVVAFMLLNIKGSNLYFWIAIIPIAIVLLVGAKLQYIIATLAIESTGGIDGYSEESRLKPRDELFWFKKPELLLSLIHFVLFQNSFELASFLWYWWQFGYDSCYIINHWLVYVRLLLGFAGQFLCSYSTLPLYALVTQMGSHYKAALIPRRIRETIHGWRRDARRRRKHRRHGDDTTTIRTETSTVCSLEDDDRTIDNDFSAKLGFTQIVVEPMCTDATTTDVTTTSSECNSPARENSNSGSLVPLIHSVSVPSSPWAREQEHNVVCRSFSMPIWRG